LLGSTFTRKAGRSQFSDGKINPAASRRTQSDEIVKKKREGFMGKSITRRAFLAGLTSSGLIASANSGHFAKSAESCVLREAPLENT